MNPSSSSSSKRAASGGGRLLFLVAFLVLIHSGYSALEHVSYLKSTNHIEQGLTLDIILEALLAMVLCFVGIIQMADPLREITLVSELRMKTLDAFESRPSYRAFGVRGPMSSKALSNAPDLAEAKTSPKKA